MHSASSMLGAVKMEGHEPSDWSSYYAEPEVGTRLFREGLGVTAPAFSPTSGLLSLPAPPPTHAPPAVLGSRVFYPTSTQMGLFFIEHTVSLEIILTL